MKTTTLPSVRVQPEFRAEVEAMLHDSETLSEFVASSVRENVQRRRQQQEFIRRGIASLDRAKLSGAYVDADVLIARLAHKLEQARAKQSAAAQ